MKKGKQFEKDARETMHRLAYKRNRTKRNLALKS